MKARVEDLIKEIELEIEDLKDRLENSRPNFYDSKILSKRIHSKEEVVEGLKRNLIS